MNNVTIATLTILLASATLRAADRPNFVWLISEDNSKHFLKLFDEHGAETPRIAELASHGFVFNHAFSNAPVCSVARTTLITSCYAPRIGTQFHRRSVLVPMPPGLKMFPAYLRDGGYYTTNNRKKDYNAIEGPGVWDESSNRASWRNRQQDQPFFHMQSFGTTHESSLHFSNDVMSSQTTDTDPTSVFIPPIHPDTPTFRYTYARYHDRIKKVDLEIGVVVDKIKADGLLEDTFIFYFGDHGGVLPGSKGYANERGLHVPLVVRVPENWKHLVDGELGGRIDRFVSFVDFGPTLLNLAGLSVPTQVDGAPFLGEGTTVDDESSDQAFGYADRFDEKYDLVRTLRKGKYKYVRSFQPFNFDGLQNNYRYKMLAFSEWRELYRAGKLNGMQRQFFEARTPEALFDLENDPFETNNLAGKASHSAVLLDLRKQLTSHLKALPDLSLYPESHLVETAFSDPVAFGRQHQGKISNLIDIANLSLIAFSEARDKIEKAMDSDDATERYWALIACSCHGKTAQSLTARAREMADADSNILVRVRAAEFLAMNFSFDPRPVFYEVLAQSKGDVQTNLILNSLVLLRDGPAAWKFDLNEPSMQQLGRMKGMVLRRWEYLAK